MKRYVHRWVHCGAVYNSQGTAATSVPTDRRGGDQRVAHGYTATCLGHKNERNLVLYADTGPKGYCAECSCQAEERQTPCDLNGTWHLKSQMNRHKKHICRHRAKARSQRGGAGAVSSTMTLTRSQVVTAGSVVTAP